MTPVPGGRWRDLGTVAVDSGQIEIIDPAMRQAGDGVVFSSGLGDGLYRVQGREINIAEAGEEPDWRIAEISIVLITQEDLDEWNDL